MFLEKKPRQSTWVYCPGCSQDMVAGDVVDCIVTSDYVYYLCECGTYSRWIFDTPAPALDRIY